MVDRTLRVMVVVLVSSQRLDSVPELPTCAPPPTIPASFLTFGHSMLYPIYATFPRIWGISALDDQLIAGLIMKLVGGAILWGFIITIWFRWYARDAREGFDAVQLTGVERDVRAGLMER